MQININILCFIAEGYCVEIKYANKKQRSSKYKEAWDFVMGCLIYWDDKGEWGNSL